MSQPAVVLVVSVLLCSTPFIWFLYISRVMFFLSRNVFPYCAVKRCGDMVNFSAQLWAQRLVQVGIGFAHSFLYPFAPRSRSVRGLFFVFSRMNLRGGFFGFSVGCSS